MRHKLATLSTCAGVFCLAASPAAAAPECAKGHATATSVGKPAARVAWRAEIVARTPLYRSVPRRSLKGIGRGSITPKDTSWLLVLRAAHDRKGRCWLQVRLPSRPNNARAWLNGGRVVLRPTRWRIVVSRRARTISVYRNGDRRRRNPADFLGSYVLPLTAHSNVLQEFGGGDGRVGIHGRGGASLSDPLGTARSHGCIRLSNDAISWLVRAVGASRLPGTPVRIR